MIGAMCSKRIPNGGIYQLSVGIDIVGMPKRVVVTVEDGLQIAVLVFVIHGYAGRKHHLTYAREIIIVFGGFISAC